MKITIDNKEFDVEDGKTILEIALENNINIPHLCSHTQLSPYGGCRLCCVEVEGMRGYPTACTTKAQENMVVITNSKILKKLRSDILQLILSEHPCGCLICEEEEECSESQPSIRKAGVTTGCRWCPKDNDCELQNIVKSIGLVDMNFPIYYRNLEVETDDPFFSRDYNLCIYCGRCVRICSEFRKSSVLALKQRGRETTIGPAFNLTHIEADCEFCGACVSVCPTGAMSEKSRKWYGVPDKYIDSVCPLCNLHCEIQILLKDNKIIGTLPIGNPHESGGELCVKGRFLLSLLVNHIDKVNEPIFKYKEDVGFISWEESIGKLIKKIEITDGKETALYISPDLTNEEFTTIQNFAEKILKTTNITSTVCVNGFGQYIKMLKESITIEELKKSDLLISLFFDGNYNFAPLTLNIKRMADRGIPYYQVGNNKDVTTRYSTQGIVTNEKKEIKILEDIVEYLENKKKIPENLINFVNSLKNKEKITFVFSDNILKLNNSSKILNLIKKINLKINSKNFIADSNANLLGFSSIIKLKHVNEIDSLIKKNKVRNVFIFGDSPFEKRPLVDFIVNFSPFQFRNSFSDILLPVAIWGELEGLYNGVIGKKEIVKVIENNKYNIVSLLMEISSKMDIDLKEKKNVDSIKQTEIEDKPDFNFKNKDLKFILSAHKYLNISLPEKIEGFNDILKYRSSKKDIKDLNEKKGKQCLKY